MEFTTEQFGQATREVFSGSVSQTEDIIDKHTKVMDKLDKKKKDVKEIIGRGEKLAEMAKAPQFLGEKLAAMKKLWNDANNEAKQRLDDLKVTMTMREIDILNKLLSILEQRGLLEYFCREVRPPSDPGLQLSKTN